MVATPTQSLAADVVARVNDLILDAERKTRPLEMEPYRGQLFELFVLAEASGLLRDGSAPDLSADGISRELSERWGLKAAAATKAPSLAGFSPEHMSKMRLLWSFLRMWMEWQYAWSRWAEFHERYTAAPSESSATANQNG